MKRGEETESSTSNDNPAQAAPKRRATAKRRTRATRSFDKLWADVAWAMKNELPARELIPMLERLASAAPQGSRERAFANRELARLLLARDAWSAARYAREALGSVE